MHRSIWFGQRALRSVIKQIMQVIPVGALDDNYMYVLVDDGSKKAAVVDPVEPKKIEKTISSLGVQLEFALITHHHWDHAGGTKELAGMYDGRLKIYGGDNRIAALTDKVADKHHLQLGSLDIECLHTPCHTTGHICYFVTGEDQKVVFTGDTLFIAGCGRFFEGTAKQMDEALNGKLASLPPETKVFCGHEYTVDDLKFAISVEPSNTAVSKKLEWAVKQRSQGIPTVPSTIDEEKQTNPFMRIRESKELQESVKSTDPIEVMDSLRRRKNNFRP